MSKTTLILHNGNLLTQDADRPTAQAVAVGADGRVRAVGSDAEVLNLAVAGVRTVDLRGRTLIPGFFDCHLHALWLGINLGHVSLASPPVRDKADIVRLLRARRDEQPGLSCLQGNGYDQNKLPGGRHITRQDLDEVATDMPVRVVHTSGHAAVVNSRALALLGITRDTPDPTGGEIERDATGEPTGVLLETASWNNVERILPETTPAQAVEALARASDYLLERGITSASDANTEEGDLEAYAQAVNRDALRVRVNCMLGWHEVMQRVGDGPAPRPEEFQPRAHAVSGHRLHVGQAKLFADGAITTRTCWLTQPFEGTPDDVGIAMHPPDELKDLIRRAHDAGWQVATHAIGDRAADAVLTAYAEAQRAHTRPRPGHRVEHAMLLDAGLISRLRRQNVWSVGQPEFLSALGDAYVTALGEERALRLSPYATLDAQDVAQAFSSDCPVVPGSPLDGMRAAVERKTPSGRVLNERERVTAETALYAYTAAPAHATRTEHDRGAIAPGKLADFTLLTADPTTTPVGEWERVRVAATFIGGECLYGSDSLEA